MFLDGKIMICDLCSKNYGDIFDSVLRIDYIETGRGKIHEYHLCLDCRRNVLDWLESHSRDNKILEEDNIA